MNTRPTLAGLRPGDLMFGPIGGFIPGFFPVGVGQVLLFLLRGWWGRVLKVRTWFRIRHVGVVVNATRTPQTTFIEAFGKAFGVGELNVVEAMPSGAREVPLLADKHWTPQYLYVRPAYDTLPYGDEPRPDRGVAVAAQAIKYVGTPYNFLTYAKLAAGAFRFRLTEALLRRWISTRKDMICSQLADQALSDAGYHVFDDGRLPQDVIPSELLLELLLKPGTRWIRPGDANWHDTKDGVWPVLVEIDRIQDEGL